MAKICIVREEQGDKYCGEQGDKLTFGKILNFVSVLTEEKWVAVVTQLKTLQIEAHS